MAKKKADSGTPANGQERPPPAYFLSLSLENVRCFGKKQTLDLSDGKGNPARWTVLLGENGVGKTTVLQALTLVEQTRRRARDESQVTQSWWDTSLPYLTFPRSEEVSATAEAVLAPLDQASALLPSMRWRTNLVRMLGGISTSKPQLSQDELKLSIPLMCGYGAGRRLGASSLSDQEVNSSASLFENIDLINAEEWLLHLDYVASKDTPSREQAELRRDQVCELLKNLLPDVEDIQFDPSSGVLPTPRVEFKQRPDKTSKT